MLERETNRYEYLGSYLNTMMNKTVFWGIKLKELLVFLALYGVFSFAYHFTLWLNRAGYEQEGDNLFDPLTYLDAGYGLQYVLFFLLTIPIWYLIFRVFRHIPVRYRLMVHILTLPAFVFGAQQIYYGLTESIGWGHLQGTGKVWDIYIPALFYTIQFGILHAYEYYKENQRKIIIEGELRQAALKSELAAIKAQLNPHFLHNIFNTINASVPPENEDTRQMIAQLADLFRYQLQASQQELVPLREELDFVKKYLNLEKARFQDRLKINIDVADELLDEPIPPMLLQPLVENSVKHGLASLIEGGTIGIKIFKGEGKLKFEISDTGVGVHDKSSIFNKGIGLSNTRVRLQKMYQSQLEILDNTPSGLTIRFAI